MPILNCTAIFPGFALSSAIAIQLDKAGGIASGSVVVVTDTTPPDFDCVDGAVTTGSLTLTPITNWQTYDNDWQENPPRGDGCPDYKELGPSQGAGGLRDPFNPYDYMNPSHDHQNRVDDVLMVVGQYFKDDSDGNPGLPPYAPGYNPDTDRTALGPNNWNLGPGDGNQRVDDILAMIKQYFHDCD